MVIVELDLMMEEAKPIDENLVEVHSLAELVQRPGRLAVRQAEMIEIVWVVWSNPADTLDTTDSPMNLDLDSYAEGAH